MSRKKGLSIGFTQSQPLRAAVRISLERSKMFAKMVPNFGMSEPLALKLEDEIPFPNQIKVGLINAFPSITALFLVHPESGEILSRYDPEKFFVDISSFSERKIGTTAYALYEKTHEFSYTICEEHFLAQFKKNISLACDWSIKDKKCVLVFWMTDQRHLLDGEMKLAEILKKNKLEENRNEEPLKHLLFNDKGVRLKIANGMAELIEFSDYNNYMLAGISREITAYRKELCQITSNRPYIGIQCETLQEALASISMTLKIVAVNMDTDIEIALFNENIFENINCQLTDLLTSCNAVVVVNLNRLSFEQQRILLKQMEDINRNVNEVRCGESPSKRIFIVKTTEAIESEGISLITPALKLLDAVPSLQLLPIRKRRQDIPFVIKAVLEKYYQGDAVEVKRAYQSMIDRGGRIHEWHGTTVDLCRWVTFVQKQKDILIPTFEKGSLDEEKGTDFNCPLKEREALQIADALKAQGYNIKKTAELLGIGRSTLYRKIELYGIGKDKS